MAMNTLSIRDLYVYPVKSMGGTRLDAAELDAFGIKHDRRWMLVDDDGVFKTQRKTPRMALIRVTVTPSGLTLDAPGMPALAVETPPAVTAVRKKVWVWNDEVEAVRAAPEAGRWCSDFLGTSCHLVHMPDDSVRPVKPRYAKAGERVHFGDRFPLLVITQESLDELNGRLAAIHETAIPMNRFRPNVVIGATPYAEDGWRDVQVRGDGDRAVGLRLVKPCGRCVITTIDQDSAVANKEPLRTLATYRRQGSAVMFGQNALHDAPGSTLRVGDPVVVVKKK
jgi:uncharacterized protein